MSMMQNPKTILVVDDDDETARAHQRILTRAGFQVSIASNGKEALEQLGKTKFRAVVSDIAMPEMDGISFLRAVRDVNLDIPVILVTASPDVKTAAAAVQYGAIRYLTKPVASDVLVGVAERATRLYEWAELRRQAALGRDGSDVGDLAAIDAQLTSALKAMWMAYQPIVRYSSREIFAYEALMRTTDPGLPHPPAILEASDRLSRHEDVGRRVRRLVATTLEAHPNVTCFVNLHVRDLLDETLYAPDAPLNRFSKRIVLELTERAALETISNLSKRIGVLRDLGFRIAVDDLGAGYSGLTSLAQLEPDIVKVDMSLIRNIDREPTKRKLVAAVTTLCQDLNTHLVVEGVETIAERDVLVDLGCDLFQGYLFARPAKPFVDVQW